MGRARPRSCAAQIVRDKRGDTTRTHARSPTCILHTLMAESPLTIPDRLLSVLRWRARPPCDGAGPTVWRANSQAHPNMPCPFGFTGDNPHGGGDEASGEGTEEEEVEPAVATFAMGGEEGAAAGGAGAAAAAATAGAAVPAKSKKKKSGGGGAKKAGQVCCPRGLLRAGACVLVCRVLCVPPCQG